jgi:hypothetical protein
MGCQWRWVVSFSLAFFLAICVGSGQNCSVDLHSIFLVSAHIYLVCIPLPV